MSIPELITKLRADVKSKKLENSPALDTPDQTLKGLLPKFNEVIIGFISEDANMRAG